MKCQIHDDCELLHSSQIKDNLEDRLLKMHNELHIAIARNPEKYHFVSCGRNGLISGHAHYTDSVKAFCPFCKEEED